MEKPSVSVIVPVYKTEKYLERCVCSLQNQTLQDIEIILVDDGSPDNCPDMCDQFAAHDSRIKVVHKKNGGLSSARNAGMKVASGKYIGFVDSDDDVEPDMFASMLKEAENNAADFVMSDYIRILSNGERALVSTNLRSGVYEKADLKREIYPALIMGENVDYGPILSVWHCMYNRKFLMANNITFANDVTWSEDNLFSAIVGYCANRFVYMKGKGLYHYYQNPETITTSYRPGALNVYEKMNRYLEEFFLIRNDYDFRRQLKLHMIYYACNTVRMECGNAETFREAKQKVEMILRDPQVVNAFHNFRLPSVPMKFKIQLWLMKYQCADVLAMLIRG